jgi:hypothetical protein
MIFIGLSVVAAQVGIRSLGQVIECAASGGFSSASSIYSIQLGPITLDAPHQKAERSTQFRGQKPMNIKWWDQNISWPK